MCRFALTIDVLDDIVVATMSDTITTQLGPSVPDDPSSSIFNPIVGATTDHPTGFPAGTPVFQSLSADNTVLPAQANAALTCRTIGLAEHPGIAGQRVLTKENGPLTLTIAQWDEVTGGSGGLVRGEPYFVSDVREGGIQLGAPFSPNLVQQVGFATSATTLFIQIFPPQAGS